VSVVVLVVVWAGVLVAEMVAVKAAGSVADSAHTSRLVPTVSLLVAVLDSLAAG